MVSDPLHYRSSGNGIISEGNRECHSTGASWFFWSLDKLNSRVIPTISPLPDEEGTFAPRGTQVTDSDKSDELVKGLPNPQPF